MEDRFNTIAGWVLFAGIIALGFSILSGKYFHIDPPAEPGYDIKDIAGPDEAAMTIAEALNMEGMEASKGEKIFAKCTACHTINAGGADGIGPNLHGVMGKAVAGNSAGFAYSSALSGVGGTWDWETMSAWLKSPRAFANGNKMSFAGLSKVEDRAALLLYINEQGSNLAVPEFVAAVADEAPAEGEAVAEEDAAAEGEEAAEAEAVEDAAAEENEGGA
ncbi:MAG: c-type cytochrome [Marinomonas sp.]